MNKTSTYIEITKDDEVKIHIPQGMQDDDEFGKKCSILLEAAAKVDEYVTPKEQGL